MKSGQASLEYMVMLAISMGIFIIILYVSGNLVSTSSSQIGLEAAYNAVQSVRESADFIYIHGHPSKTQINVYVPPNIEAIEIVNNNTLVFKIGVGEYYTDIYGVTRGKITGDVTTIQREGYYVLNVFSISDEFTNISLM